MDENPADEGMSVLTSLPDVSERPGEAAQWSFDGWKDWFGHAVRRILRWVPEQGVAIFYQSDIRLGAAWVDKGYLVQRAAEQEAATLLWHKIVCRKPPGTIALGRSSYSHLLCLTRGTREAPRRPGPDVLADAGEMNWSRAMGTRAAEVALSLSHRRDEHPHRRRPILWEGQRARGCKCHGARCSGRRAQREALPGRAHADRSEGRMRALER
jgi:hypothetical protein